MSNDAWGAGLDRMDLVRSNAGGIVPIEVPLSLIHISVKNRRYTSGEFALAPGRNLYVHRGVGYLKRVRFNMRPEITAFTLRATKSLDV